MTTTMNMTDTTPITDGTVTCWGDPSTALHQAAVIAANALAGFRQGRWRLLFLDDLARYKVTPLEIKEWLRRHPEAYNFRA